MIDLSSQQTAALHAIREWHAQARAGLAPNVFRLFGPAGTGKTTLARQVPAALGLDVSGFADLGPLAGPRMAPVVYGTFTGKAAHVLRSKGASPVSTIHSAIYFPTSSLEARQALAEAREEVAALEKEWAAVEAAEPEAKVFTAVAAGWASPMELAGALSEAREKIPELEAATRRVSWELNPESDWAMADLIIVDEVSMVGTSLGQDVESFGVPILVLGDPAQLPPVDGGGYWTDATPDVLLTEIHRTALDNPITALATRVRESTGVKLGVSLSEMEPPSVARAAQFDQVICWTNRRRWALIRGIRKLQGRPDGIPVAGDKIMCLTNNKDLAVFNGQQFTVLDTAPATLGPTLTVLDDAGNTRVIPCFADGFLDRESQDLAKKAGSGMRGGRMLATFATAITAHKAQGSEYGSVYVVNELLDMIASDRRGGKKDPHAEARRWLYTAVTRAQCEVVITTPKSR